MAELQEFMIQGNLNKKEYKAFAPIGTDEEYILNNFRKSENYVKPDEYRPYDFNELNKLVGGKHFEAPFNKDSLKKYRQLVKDLGMTILLLLLYLVMVLMSLVVLLTIVKKKEIKAEQI